MKHDCGKRLLGILLLGSRECSAVRVVSVTLLTQLARVPSVRNVVSTKFVMLCAIVSTVNSVRCDTAVF
jgi:hypothetical protein